MKTVRTEQLILFLAWEVDESGINSTKLRSFPEL